MALATQCPHCHTTFRVAHDQLKLRAGLVRCGACKQIFNGIENLLRPEDLVSSASAPPPAFPHRSPPAPPASDEFATSVATQPDLNEDTSVEPAAEATVPEDELESDALPVQEDRTAQDDRAPSEEEVREDPLLRMTLMDFTHERREPADGVTEAPASADSQDNTDAVERAIDDLSSKPWRRELDDSGQAEADPLDQADADGYVEPAFVRQGRRKERIGRILRIFMMTASVFLLVSLLAQGAYVFRDRIAAWFPAAKPVLAEACAYLGCQVGLPAQIDDVAIESNELQTLAAGSNAFSLTILLRNHSATDQAWPHIELTLNDANETPILRRVFTPRDYLPPSQDVKTGFAARSEQPVKLFFEVSQLKASGYRVYLFYP